MSASGHRPCTSGRAGAPPVSRPSAGTWPGTASTAPGAPATEIYLTATQHAADDSASGLVVFAIAAAVAGAFVVGQAIQRHLLLGATGLRQLVDLGMTRSQTATIAAIPVVGATTIGSMLGVVAAALLSPLLPIGLAGRAEVAPGVRIDLPILLACAAGAIVLVAGFSLHRRADPGRPGPANGQRCAVTRGCSTGSRRVSECARRSAPRSTSPPNRVRPAVRCPCERR